MSSKHMQQVSSYFLGDILDIDCLLDSTVLRNFRLDLRVSSFDYFSVGSKLERAGAFDSSIEDEGMALDSSS